VRLIGNRLDVLLDIMKSAGINVASYRQELITATGEITTDILDVHVVSGLIQRAGTAARLWLRDAAPTFLFKLVLVVVILMLARIGSRLARKIAARAFDRASFGTTALRRHIAISSLSKAVTIIGVLLALSQLGFSAGNLLAGLGVAGIIVGLALQSTLSNFTAGLLILLYRPFDIGDAIEVAGVAGAVRGMTLANTTLLTADNQTIVIPNNNVWSNVIKNTSLEDNRRVDMSFTVSHDTSVEEAERILRDIVAQHPKVLPNPAPIVRLNAIADASMTFVVWPWTHRLNYQDVLWDITREVKIRFDASAISHAIPRYGVQTPAGPAARSG
jgi:small conductance mechanosensitive channel